VKLTEKNSDTKLIESLIVQGLEICDARLKERFDDLREQLLSSQDRKRGEIKFFDSQRQFGVITYEKGTCIFFPNGFREETSLIDLAKKEVTFVLIRDHRKIGSFKAVDIVFENQAN
jgi:hypothetical protein